MTFIVDNATFIMIYKAAWLKTMQHQYLVPFKPVHDDWSLLMSINISAAISTPTFSLSVSGTGEKLCETHPKTELVTESTLLTLLTLFVRPRCCCDICCCLARAAATSAGEVMGDALMPSKLFCT
jgi:hypothetical protein